MKYLRRLERKSRKHNKKYNFQRKFENGLGGKKKRKIFQLRTVDTALHGSDTWVILDKYKSSL